MISRHHYPDREHPPAWEQNPVPDDYTRIAAALDAEDAADRAAGVDVWDRAFPPPAPGVCDCDEPLVRTGQGDSERVIRPSDFKYPTRRDRIETALFMAFIIGVAVLLIWGGIRYEPNTATAQHPSPAKDNQ